MRGFGLHKRRGAAGKRSFTTVYASSAAFKFCHQAKLASCIVIAREAVKLGFTSLRSANLYPSSCRNRANRSIPGADIRLIIRLTMR